MTVIREAANETVLLVEDGYSLGATPFVMVTTSVGCLKHCKNNDPSDLFVGNYQGKYPGCSECSHPHYKTKAYSCGVTQ